MAQNDTFKRYLDAGMAFTQLSRERAEEFVKDLVKAGEVRRKETEEVIEALLDRSRKNTEELVNLIRSEIAEQLRGLGLEDVAKRAGLPGRVVEAAEDADDAAARVADTVDADAAPEPAAAAGPRKKKAAAKKPAPEKPAPEKPAPEKPAPEKPAPEKPAPTTDTPLVVPGAPKTASAKKLIVPPAAAATVEPPKKATPAKKAAAKKPAPKKS